MNNKKMKSMLILSMFLVSAFAIVQTASADSTPDNPRTVRGYVYIDGIIEKPEDVKISIDGQDVTASLYNDGYYIIDFSEEPGETGEFIVTTTQASWMAAETVTIQTGVYIYRINLTIDTSEPPINNAPNAPTNPSPSNGANNRGTNTDLSWSCTDPDGDSLNYDVYMDTNNPPTNVVSDDQTSTSYNPSLSYDTTYYWQIVATDEHGSSTDGAIWSFTTEEESSGGGGDPTPPPNGGGGETPIVPPSGDTNDEPTADAGGPYTDFVNTLVSFDGSASTDSDGSIDGYRWDFDNDGTYDTDWLTQATTSYTYTSEYSGLVKLQVKDDEGATDTDTVTVTISQANNPPTPPAITGTSSGTKNVNYDFIASSTDEDGDMIKYVFYWDDGTNTQTEYLDSGIETTQSHSWSSSGKYSVKVNAYDGEAWSGNSTYSVNIDRSDISSDDVNGYLIDDDGDGIYDKFHNDATDEKTDTEKEDDKYLLNTDDDEDWEFEYDETTGTVSKYSSSDDQDDDDTEDNKGSDKTDNAMFFYAAGLIAAVVILLFVFFVSKKRKNQK